MKFKDFKEANQAFQNFVNNLRDYVVIHYSCQGFFEDYEGCSPRITSIAIYDCYTGQNASCSISKEAEIRRINLINASEQELDACEKALLDEFYHIVIQQKEKKWIHWNMRNMKYGFQAIDHRYKVLGGVPVSINDALKIDLAALLIKKYGSNYIEDPHMLKLAEKNNFSRRDFLTGKEESAAFQEGQFSKLHDSTMQKARIIHLICERAANDKLLTNAHKLKDMYGLSLQGIFDYARNNFFLTAILWLLTIIASGIFGWLISK